MTVMADGPLDRTGVAREIAADIPRGAYVNLGIGQPTTVADHLRVDSGVTLHTENGMLGMGPAAVGDDIDLDLITMSVATLRTWLPTDVLS